VTPAEPGAGPDVTGLLLRWSEGDADALEQLMPLVYQECRRIAERQLRLERGNHTLSPTAVVHELYMRLVDQQRATWQSRAQFYAVAARLMRRVLVDHARARLAQKRGASPTFVSLDAAAEVASEPRVADVLAIDEALERLGRLDPEQQRLVELRFFAGLTVEEAAAVLGISPATLKRRWTFAKAWLVRELGGP
jgi:RNA polymerase sigma factor (TIGR02999 family)